MSRYLIGVVCGFALAAGVAVSLTSFAAQSERSFPQRLSQPDPWVLSEQVQRIAREEQIWRRQVFTDVESYVDFLTLADNIAKRRLAEQMGRKGNADLDQEYRAAFAILCVIPLPGKPPSYSEQFQEVKMALARRTFSSAAAREAALRNVRSEAYSISADELKSASFLSPRTFFRIGQ